MLKKTNQKPKVLIVEDDADLAEILALTLEEVSEEVRVCNGLEEAIRHAESSHFDVIICDYHLSNLESGFDLWKWQKNHAQKSQFIMMSGGDLPESQTEVPLFLQKPFSLEEFQALYMTKVVSK